MKFRQDRLRLVERPAAHEADDRYIGLLCTDRTRPRDDSTQRRNELPPPHSIASTAGFAIVGSSVTLTKPNTVLRPCGANYAAGMPLQQPRKGLFFTADRRPCFFQA